MKKVLTIIVIGLLWFVPVSADDLFKLVEREGDPKIIISSNLSYNFEKALAKEVNDLLIYLGQSKNDEKLPLVGIFYQTLQTNSSEFHEVWVNNEEYFVVSGCRKQSCHKKSLLWIDKKKKIVIGAMIHFFLDSKSSYIGKNHLLIFSKKINSAENLPKNFKSILNDWISVHAKYDFKTGKKELLRPEIINFINSKNIRTDISKKTDILSKTLINDYNKKLLNKELTINEVIRICNEYESKNIDIDQYDLVTFNKAVEIENYCTTKNISLEFNAEAQYNFVQDSVAQIDIKRLNFKFINNNFFKLSFSENNNYSCKLDIRHEKRVTFFDISRRCGVKKIITQVKPKKDSKCTSEPCNLAMIEYEDEDSLKNNWINIIGYFYADANNDDYMDLVIVFQLDGEYSLGSEKIMTAIVTSFKNFDYVGINSLEKRYIDKHATYVDYLKTCSKYEQSYGYRDNILGIDEVEIFKGKDLNVDCLVKKFEDHYKAFPAKSFLTDKPLAYQKIILNKETLKSIINNFSYERYELSSFVDQKCDESCVYTSEALIIYRDQYWLIKGSNDRGLKAEMYSMDDFLITNFMTTHIKKYNYKGNNTYPIDNNVTTSFAKNNNIYLNGCTPNPHKYFDKPLTIKNILIEVPNKIIKLEKNRYERAFQTLAISAINLANNKIDISVSNFRDLTIKNDNGKVLVYKKISGASSLYEIKHKDKVVAWGVGWNKICGGFYSTDFSTFRIFLPVKKDEKISIEEKLISLNLTQTYKAVVNSENLIVSDAKTIFGSSDAVNYYYGGQKFYELDGTNGIKSIDSYEELHKKIDVLKLSSTRTIKVLADFYEHEVLHEYTKANFDNIYKDLLTKHMDIFYQFYGENLVKSISDLNISDEFKKAWIKVNNMELSRDNLPLIDWEISKLKKNCFKQDTYESMKELVRNCYFFHSSYLLEYGFNDAKWFATQTEFKDSKDLLKKDKDKRFEEYLKYNIRDIKSFVLENLGMQGTVVDELLDIFKRANSGYTKSKDNRYVVISGCEYKNCNKKGLVFIDTETNSTIALISHQSFQADKSDSSLESNDWLILSYWYDKYKDLPKEFLDAVNKWRLIEGQAKEGDALALPRVIRYVGGISGEIEVLRK